MTPKEAKKLKDHDYITDGTRYYHVRIHHWNKHDLWFWHCKKHTKQLLQRAGGAVTCVCLGSRNLKANNLDFLTKLQPS